MSLFSELKRRSVLRVGAAYVVTAWLAVSLGYFAFDKFVLDLQREEKQAIQQQAELEQARDQEYLSDGIAEDILNLLQHTPQLDARSRTFAFRFNGGC